MYAVEFQTTVKNGHIELPEQYRARIKDQVRVIVLVEDEQKSRAELLEDLFANPIQLKDATDPTLLTREEIYADRYIR